MTELELFLEITERIPLMPAATPMHRLNRLEETLDYQNIYIKRDDLTGIGTGGNKVRSLEFLLGEALADGCDRILVSGPGQSNLCMLTAAACAKLGIVCEAVYNCDRPVKPEGNFLLTHILGIREHFLGRVDASERKQYTKRLAADYAARGNKPYIIKNGATSGRGALGYAAAVPELIAQCVDLDIEDLTIFVPGGNGGMAAGLIYGNALSGSPFQIVVVSVEDEKKTLESNLLSVIEEIEGLTGLLMGIELQSARLRSLSLHRWKGFSSNRSTTVRC